MTDPSEDERLGLLLRELPPAPRGWVDAAAAMPEVRAALDELDERLIAGAADRARETEALEDALRRADLEPTPERVLALRRISAARREDG
jgi:hypothetical protein